MHKHATGKLEYFHPRKVIICLRLIVHAEFFCLSATLHVLLINSALLRASFLIFYQLMASGVNGSRGLNARDLVEVEYKHVLARALIPAQLMEEKNVSVAKRRQSHVTAIIVQVYFVKIKSLVLKGMVFFCNYSVSFTTNTTQDYTHPDDHVSSTYRYVRRDFRFKTILCLLRKSKIE